MARIPQKNELTDIQLSIKDVNDETRALQKKLEETQSKIPSPKDVDQLQKDVIRLSKTPTFLDPNDVFRASGPAHMHGYVPDPGVTPGASRFLREDGTWAAGGGGGVTDHPSLTHRSDAHQHPATAVDNTPYGHIAATDVQAALDELDDEKLARDGSQTMLGALDMNHNNVNNVNDLEVEEDATVGRDLSVTRDVAISRNEILNGGVGTAQLTGVRKIHMVGLESDAEARIENVAALAFQEVTPTPEVKRLAWDALEKTLVLYVSSGSVVVAVAAGWFVKLAIHG